MTRKQPPAAPPPVDPSDPLFGDVAAPAPAESKALAPQVERDGTFTDKAVTRREGLVPETEVTKESVAVGAQIRAQIAARTLHAMQNPRSFDDARVAILRDCRRPAFAKAAVYSLPPRGEGGKRIEGLSIRFAEAALAHWGNVASESIILYEDAEKRVVRIGVVDLETNTSHSRDITISKRVERKFARDRVIITERLNSEGKPVFVVQATDEEVTQAEARERSRVMRNEGLRIIPADIRDEALALCRQTATTEDAKDPDAARKALADAFAELGVRPPDIAAYLGCELAQTSPAQLADLRDVWTAIRDGDATWQQFVAARTEDLSPDEEKAEGGSRVDDIKQRARERAAERKAAKS